MANTALGAEKEKAIIFISDAHEKFYYEKLKGKNGKKAEKRKLGKHPSERGRNYTPLQEVVHCALPGASCGQQMISTDFQSAPIITGDAALPPRWPCQLPLCGLAPGTILYCKLFPSDRFSEIQLYFFNGIAYNEASEKSEVVGVI